MLGKKSIYAQEAYEGRFIGTDFIKDKDISNDLFEDWREFNAKFIPVYLITHPEKNKIAAGLACGMFWTVAKGIKIGDIVLCPDGKGNYYIGEIKGDYEYHKDKNLPHRRAVSWFSIIISREKMSESLRNSSGSIGTVSEISKYADEIESFISGKHSQTLFSSDETVEDPNEFALEKHLEDFLVKNWGSTELGQDFDVYQEEGEFVGQQYPTDTGPIDILAISKDKKKILVIELKKGRASDVVVGQVLRYMGYVKEELAEMNQTVHGIIIALEDDPKTKRALSVTQNIDFYTYRIDFKLKKKN